MSMGKSSTPCQYFKQGRCWYTDEECRFAHILPSNPPLVRGTGNPPPVRARASGSRENNIDVESSGRVWLDGERIFTAAESCCFAKTEAWDEKRLDAAGIKAIRFLAGFNIKDTHLAAIPCRPNLTSQLVCLSLGSSDSGNGSWITDSAIIDFVHACPNLRVLRLESATRLTDAALSACCDSCPLLELLSITGNDKVSGSLTGSSLKRLTDSPKVAKNLIKLVLYDQRSCSYAQVKKLSKSRRVLAIQTGNTVGDGMADSIVAQLKGGETTETWLGGKVASSYTDWGADYDF